MEPQTCQKCGTQFVPSEGTKGKSLIWCKPCNAKYMREYRATHKEAIKQNNLRSRQKHGTKYLERRKAKYHALPLDERRRYGRATRLWSVFRIRLPDYEKLLEGQDRKCAICGKPCVSGRFLAVDHDHDSGKIRGLLCILCNLAIQRLDTVPNWCQLAHAYLERHQGNQLPDS